MAHPSDPRNAADPSAFGFANARLTLEEAERLAATFRPSWQVDEAPASGANVQGRQGAPADQRTAVQTLNGNYPPAPATVHDELDRSVIIDPAIAPPVAAPPPAARTATVPSVQTRTVVMPTMGGVDPRLRGPVAPGRGAGASVPPRRSLDFGETEFPKRSRKGLWVGLAAVLAAVIGVGVWTLSGSNQKAAALPAPAPPANVQTVETRAAAAPPHPPPEAPAAVAPPPVPQAPPPVPPPAAATTAATIPTIAAAPPPPPVAAAPVAPRIVVPPAPRPPTWIPPPAARPAPRPKPPGATIVRDVPF